jgi:hypothetical protein
VLFRRRAFHAELHYPVNLPAALAFRRMALLQALGPLALLAAAGLIGRWILSVGGTGLPLMLIELAMTAVLAVALWLFLTAATDAPAAVLGRSSMTRQQQLSVGALAYYTCGPLAITTPLGVLCIALGIFGGRHVATVYGSGALMAAFLLPLAVPLAWIFALARLAREGLGRSEISVLRLSLSLSARWCWAAIVWLGLLPFAAAYPLLALVSILQG